LGHAGLGAICISQNGEWEQIHTFISKVKTEVERNEGEKWTPIVCIDKDASERRALVELGLDFITCKTHNDRTFREQLASRWKGKQYESLRNKIMERVNEVER